MLSALFPPIKKLDSNTRAEQKDAKIDIYNYAARFDCIPNFESRVVAPFKGRQKKLVEVSVDLPEQNIHVVARAFDSFSAELTAALKFKKQAELYHAHAGKGSIVVRDLGALTTANARGFFDFYKIITPNAKVALSCEPGRDATRNSCYKSQVTINSILIGRPVEMRSKKGSEDLAYLTAAIALKKEQPHFFPRFFEALKAGNGTILKPVPPTRVQIKSDAVFLMDSTLHAARELNLLDRLDDKTDQPILEEETFSRSRPPRYLLPRTPLATKQRDSQMQEAHRAYLQDITLDELRWKRSQLPMSQYRAKVLDLINKHQYSIIVGATGSGKTTQVPQIILEEAVVKGSGSACNVICTQPRRIAARSVARRVAQERAELLQATVGYHVRSDAKLPLNRGSISFCTTGTLLLQLQRSPDAIMDAVSHLIVDEIHDRATEVDFLLVTLKRLIRERTLSRRPCPKVVLMSATIDTDLFATYFSHGQGIANCPSLTVPGRTFPVKEKYLDSILDELKQSYPASSLRLLQDDDPTSSYLTINKEFLRETISRATALESVIDWKKERKLSAEGEMITCNETDDALVPNALVATTIAHIAKTSDQGAILAFLPGIDEIVRVEKWLTETQLLGLNFRDNSQFKIYMLHSSIAEGQTEVFDVVPRGCRKIILATNIAETSITIPDVQFVVDTGKVREKHYDQIRRISHLKCTWISKSNSKQRAGRAGRVQDGNYYALFPKEIYNSMRASAQAEILRSDLQETCLAIRAQAFTVPIREFLGEALEPPPPKAVDASVINLKALDALTSDEELTPLGRLLAKLPIHPSLGKMIILGVIFRCLDPMLIIGAATAERPIFVQPLSHRREAQEAKYLMAESYGSDHIAIVNAVHRMLYHSRSGPEALRAYAMRSFIHFGAYTSTIGTAKQIENILINAGLIPFTAPSERQNLQFGPPSLNQNSANISLIKAIALAGLHPNLATVQSPRFLRTPGEGSVMIHPSSVNTSRSKHNEMPLGTLYSYSSMVNTSQGNLMFIRDTTRCTPLMAALFGGKIKQTSSNSLEMDDWLRWWINDGFDRGSMRIARTIVAFREALERVLSLTFRDLSNLDKPKSNKQALAETANLLSLFTDGVVQLLDREVQSTQMGSRGQAQEPVRPNFDTMGHPQRRVEEDRTRETSFHQEAGYMAEPGYYERAQNDMKDLYAEHVDILPDRFGIQAGNNNRWERYDERENKRFDARGEHRREQPRESVEQWKKFASSYSK